MGCPSCVDEVIKWNSLLKDKNYKRIHFMVILVGEYSEYTYFHLIENKDLNFQIYWDSANSFVKRNHLNYLELEKSILLDNDNRILVIGSPLSDKRIERQYKKMLRNTK